MAHIKLCNADPFRHYPFTVPTVAAAAVAMSSGLLTMWRLALSCGPKRSERENLPNGRQTSACLHLLRIALLSVSPFGRMCSGGR